MLCTDSCFDFKKEFLCRDFHVNYLRVILDGRRHCHALNPLNLQIKPKTNFRAITNNYYIPTKQYGILGN